MSIVTEEQKLKIRNEAVAFIGERSAPQKVRRVVRMLKVLNEVRDQEGVSPFDYPLSERQVKDVYGTLQNEVVPHDMLFDYFNFLARQQREVTTYVVFNPIEVGNPGDTDVRLPYTREMGEAQIATQSEYSPRKGDMPVSNTIINSKSYAVQRVYDSFHIAREEILQYSSIGRRFSFGGIDIISLKSENAFKNVERKIDSFVYQSFKNQFKKTSSDSGKPFPIAVATGDGSWWGANSAATGEQLIGDLSKLVDRLTQKGVFIPRVLIMSPSARTLLATKFLGAAADRTVAERFGEILQSVYNDGDVPLELVVTTQVEGDGIYLCDNSPSNMVVGMTENTFFDEPNRIGSDYEQDVVAKTLGFVPAVSDCAVKLATSY